MTARNIRHDVIGFSPIYDFVRWNRDIPHGTRDRAVFRRYGQIVEGLLQPVPDDPGWYCWADKDRPVYIGKSAKRKTSSLRARLGEELLDERAAFWATVFDREKVIRRHVTKYRGKYEGVTRRAVEKRGADRLFWIACRGVTEGELDVVEQKLIWIFRPRANKDRRDYSKVNVDLFPHVEGLFRRYLSGVQP